MKDRNVLGGLFIIFLGIVFLLNNFGLVGWDIWTVVFDLWPLILIAVGLRIIFRKSWLVQVLSFLLIFAVPLACYLIGGGVEWGAHRLDFRGDRGAYSWSFDSEEGIKEGKLDLRLGAGALTIQADSVKMLSVDAFTFPEPVIDAENKVGRKDFKITQNTKRFFGPFWQNGTDNWQISLGKDILWDLNIDIGASTQEIDLRGITFNKLDIDSGAGNLSVIIGNIQNDAEIDIGAGAGSITIEVPGQIGIKAEIDTGVGAKNLEGRSWTQEGNTYISSNYEEAQFKLIIDLDAGAGRVTIKTLSAGE